jgi:tetratricopeptide (TPR) repeat protein
MLRWRSIAMLMLPLVLACGSRQLPSELSAPTDEAQRLMAEGCYQCLQDAFAAYEREATATRSRRARRGMFNAALLLALRAKELGLPDESAVGQVQQLATQVGDDGLGPLPSAQTYLAALSLVQGDLAGLDPDRRAAQARQFASRWTTDGTMPRARLELERATADMVTQYIALAIDCEDAQARKRINAEAIRAQHSSPLIAFRLALCEMDGPTLSSLRRSDARWVDTLLFEGRFEMASRGGGNVARAADLFTAAHDAFPDSAAITLALAGARNTLGEHAVALELYDSVLLKQPGHGDALLGRLMSLSHLARHFDAIAVATTLVERGSHELGAAYYWRGWNRYRAHQLALAWDDIRAAESLSADSSVLTLAGYIAYARQWPETAIDRLQRAFALDDENCDAVWTEALVHVDKEGWMTAASRFATAVSCFAAVADQIRRDLRAAEQVPSPTIHTTRRVAMSQSWLSTTQHRRAQAAYNAAASFARCGRNADAIAYADVAAEHALLREKALALKSTLPDR